MEDGEALSGSKLNNTTRETFSPCQLLLGSVLNPILRVIDMVIAAMRSGEVKY